MWSGDLLDQHIFTVFPALGLAFSFYVIKYHAGCNNALSGGLFCDSPLYFVSRVLKVILKVFLVILMVQPIEKRFFEI